MIFHFNPTRLLHWMNLKTKLPNRWAEKPFTRKRTNHPQTTSVFSPETERRTRKLKNHLREKEPTSPRLLPSSLRRRNAECVSRKTIYAKKNQPAPDYFRFLSGDGTPSAWAEKPFTRKRTNQPQTTSVFSPETERPMRERVQYTLVFPYRRYSVTLLIIPWLRFTERYLHFQTIAICGVQSFFLCIYYIF